MGLLTTHVLDTAHGQPAAGIPVRLFKHDDKSSLLKSVVTNADGRTDEPLLGEAEFSTGGYDLIFGVGEYYSQQKVIDLDDAFLTDVIIRFRINRNEHYHVPLLVSPWSYSTYRGS